MAFQNSLVTGVADTELAYYNKGVAEFNSKKREEACKSMNVPEQWELSTLPSTVINSLV